MYFSMTTVAATSRFVSLKWTIAVGAALLCGVSVSPAQEPGYSFTWLGDLPGGVPGESNVQFNSRAHGVSADGSVVIGMSVSSSNTESFTSTAFQWTPTAGMASLGDLPGARFNSWARGVSDDGAVIVGCGESSANGGAFRWTGATGMNSLGDLPGGTLHGCAYAVSADNVTIVGASSSSSSFASHPQVDEAFRWTSAEGMMPLGDLPGGLFGSEALAVSNDGSVVVGGSFSGAAAGVHEAFRWTSTDGMAHLGFLPGGRAYSQARDVSADGTVVVGQSGSGATPGQGDEAFRWTSEDGMVGLGVLSSGRTSSAEAISADGTVIVGTSDSPTFGGSAFVWTPSTGMLDLRSLLAAAGVADLPAAYFAAYDVSADGRTIVGYARNSAGKSEAWMATIPDLTPVPEPATASLAAVACACLIIHCVRRRDQR